MCRHTEDASGDVGQVSVSRRGLLTLAAVLVIGWSAASLPSYAQSEDSSSSSSASSSSSSVRSGMVTGTYGGTIEIDMKKYEVNPSAVIKDERGNELQLEVVGAVMPGTPVKFVLNRGRIQEMVLTLAR